MDECVYAGYIFGNHFNSVVFFFLSYFWKQKPSAEEAEPEAESEDEGEKREKAKKKCSNNKQ